MEKAKRQTLYILFRETNDWEGETWNFYINLDKNEKHLPLLKQLSKKLETNECNSDKSLIFDFNPITEKDFVEPEMIENEEFDPDDENCEVDEFVPRNSYLDEVNIIDTELNVAKLEELLKEEDEEELYSKLYKGDILNIFEN